MINEPDIARFSGAYRSIVDAVGRVLLGLDDRLEETLTAMLAGGHVLLEGPPGTGKTLMAAGIARACGLSTARVQFTPDLTPTDIIGATVYERDAGTFRFERGPVFTEILVADEINRAPAKTQAALLEAMQERRVSVDGTGHELGQRFFVVATQNPIEMEGTYPLPEAQLDRFMMKVSVGYPEADAEASILRAVRDGAPSSRLNLEGIPVVADGATLDALRAMPAALRVDDSLLDYLARVTRATRTAYGVETGASPRAGVALLAACRVRALASGRDYVTPDDVKALSVPVLAHRLKLTPDSELEGLAAAEVIAAVLSSEEVPR